MMNALALLSDPKKLKKGLQLAILLPTMISIVAAVNNSMMEATDAEKRIAALGVVDRIADLLTQTGHVTADMMVGIDQVALELHWIVAEGLRSGISTEALNADQGCSSTC